MAENILSARGISVVFNNKQIIENVDMILKKGEFVGIIGPNGAGKSTFLKAVRGIVPKSAGEVYIGEESLDNLSEKEIAKQLAFMQQDMQIGFGFTAEEVVLSARYPYLAWWENESQEDRRIAEECMNFTGVSHLRDQLISQLSGGERQRVLLAKILAQQTDIIFLDEPTASLDLVYQEEIFRYCRELTQNGKTIVMICHDLTMAARFCSRIILLSKGKVIAEGSPFQVLTRENIQQGFGLDALVYDNPVSGELDIYVLEKKEAAAFPSKSYIAATGSKFGALVRALYGKTELYSSIPPENTLDAYCAKVFSVHTDSDIIPSQEAYAFVYGISEPSSPSELFSRWEGYGKVYFDYEEWKDILNPDAEHRLAKKIESGQYINLGFEDCLRRIRYSPEKVW